MNRIMKKQVRIHDKTSRVLLGRGSNAQKLLEAQEKLKKVNGRRTDVCSTIQLKTIKSLK